MDVAPARTSSANMPVDTDDLLKRCLGRMDIVERILSRFQGVLDSELDQLEQALRDSNTDDIVQIAHRIKGASLAVSAYDLSEHASQIEKSATVGQREEIQLQFEHLKESRTLFRDVYPLAAKNTTSQQPSGDSIQENPSCES